MDDAVTHPLPPAAEPPGSFPDPAPPLVAPSRLERLRGPLVTAAVVGGLTVALHIRDPHGAGSWGECPWRTLTGLYCPGCGGLRAVNDLTNGDLVGAASSNLVFVVMVPVLVLWWLRWTGRAWSGADSNGAERERTGQRAGAWIALFTVVMVAFGVLRNLPAGSWLAP